MQWLVLICWALVVLVGADECPDGGRCGVGQTCCNPNGAASSGGKHCCPEGFQCSADGRSCIKEGDVPCDDREACPDGDTCCKTKTGRWSCCPLPEAVCCDDHVHCCPSGTTCDLPTLTCHNSSGSTPMQQKMPAFATKAPAIKRMVSASSEQTEEEPEEDKVMMDEEDEEEENRVVEGMNPCDAHTSCPHSFTCCFMSSSQRWGCCPLPEAVCCADGDHCCPAHYKCSEHQTSCIKGDVVIPWYTKLPATTSVQAENLETVPLTPLDLSEHQPQLRDVPCDEKTSCKDGETCCRMSATTWGCCPSPDAVCCSDRVHCCPNGFTCTETGDCTLKSSLHWYE